MEFEGDQLRQIEQEVERRVAEREGALQARFRREAARVEEELRTMQEESLLRLEALTTLFGGTNQMDTEDQPAQENNQGPSSVVEIAQPEGRGAETTGARTGTSVEIAQPEGGGAETTEGRVEDTLDEIVRPSGQGAESRGSPNNAKPAAVETRHRIRRIPEEEIRGVMRVHLKPGQHPWHEGDDYALWKSIMMLEMGGSDCLFLVKRGVQPFHEYSRAEKLTMSSIAKAYLISNMPEKYQRLMVRCDTPLEMLDRIDQAIQPPSLARENGLQVQFINLLFTPQTETVVDFRGRVDEIVQNIQRCPEAELPESTIRRNVLNAIAGACPRIYMDALEDRSISLNKIFDRMTAQFDAQEECLRRTREGTSSALFGAQPSQISRSNRRRNQGQTGPTQSRGVEDNTCFKCGQQGHWARTCKSKNKVCYNCHKAGHKARNCPDPETEEAKKIRLAREHRLQRRRQSKDPKEPNKGTKRKSNQTSAQKKLRSVVHKVTPTKDTNTKSVVAAIATRRPEESDGEMSIGSAFSMYDGKGHQIRFIADSGATEHMVNDPTVFTSLKRLSKPIRIVCANNDRDADMCITQSGDIIFYNEEVNRYGVLRDVLFAPAALQNLFSIKKQIQRGLVAKFDRNQLQLIDSKTDEIVKTGYWEGSFWWLTFSLPSSQLTPEVRAQILNRLNNSLGIAAAAREVDSEIVVDQDESSENRNNGRSESEVSTRDAADTGEVESVGHTDMEVSSKDIQSQRSDGNIEKRNQTRSENLGGSQSNKNAEQEAIRLRDSVGLKWHHRLNHASQKYLVMAGKVIPELKEVNFGNEILDCADCKLAKAKRKPCSAVRSRSVQPFHRLYSDLMGPIRPVAFRTQARYLVTFTDDASRYAFAYELRDKTRVNLALAECLADIRKLMGSQTKVSELRSDGGLEYRTQEMSCLLRVEGITLTVCEPYTPQHNGVAERLNLELEEKIRVNLASSGIPMFMWAYAMRHVLYIHNRTPNAANEFHSPFEVVMKRVPVLKYIRRFGCEAYILDNKAKSLPKFAPRANLGFLLECRETGYTLWHAANKTVVRSKNVDFVEDKTYADYLQDPQREAGVQTGQNAEALRNEEFEVEDSVKDLTRSQCQIPGTSKMTPMDVEGEKLPPESSLNRKPNGVEREQQDSLVRIGSSRDADFFESNQESRRIGGTKEFDFFEENEGEAYLMQLAALDLDPVTYLEAVESADSDHWQAAIGQEFDAIEKCDTWKIVQRKAVPRGQKIMKTRWVHRRKLQADGTTRYRSRLVVKGFADTNHYELSEIYAPVARLPDVRFILIVAAKYDLELSQLDVKTAFLNGSLDKLVYIEIPEGYAEYLGEGENLRKESVCEVHKALYGLKVSPKRWYVRFLEVIEKMEFRSYSFQPCIFIWKNEDKIAMLLLYVDDILLASNSAEKVTQVKSILENEFSITDLGAPRKFLGMEIERDRVNGVIKLHQKTHINSMLQKYDPDSSITVATPMMDSPINKRKVDESEDEWDKSSVPYRQAIGTLLYLQNGTRPDISYAVNMLSRYQSNFTRKHWLAVVRVIRYLRGTTELGLVFNPRSENIDCYVDASLGMSAEGGYSTTGFIVWLFDSPIVWRTKKQNHIALSSAEAEFVAMSSACRELASLRAMSEEILGIKMIPVIHEDSKPAIRLAEVDDSSTLKHLVRLSYLYVREEHKQGNIQIRWVDTENQIADTFTKPLGKAKFNKFRARLLSVI